MAYKIKYGDLLKEVQSYQNCGTLWECQTDSHVAFTDDERWKKLPPSKTGYQANLMSLTLSFHFDVKHSLKHLPRKKKKKVMLAFNRRIKTLKKEIKRMYPDV